MRGVRQNTACLPIGWIFGMNVGTTRGKTGTYRFSGLRGGRERGEKRQGRHRKEKKGRMRKERKQGIGVGGCVVRLGERRQCPSIVLESGSFILASKSIFGECAAFPLADALDALPPPTRLRLPSPLRSSPVMAHGAAAPTPSFFLKAC